MSRSVRKPTPQFILCLSTDHIMRSEDQNSQRKLPIFYPQVLLLRDEEERGDPVQAVGLGPDAAGPHHLPHRLLRPRGPSRRAHQAIHRSQGHRILSRHVTIRGHP